jgi:CRP-like cAMP-binding protein
LLQIAKPVRAPKRGQLFVEGGPGARVFLLASGRVRLERAGLGGASLHVAHLGHGDFLGDLALTGQPARETAITPEETLALAFETAELRELAAREPGVIQALAMAMTEQRRNAEERLLGLMRCNVETRLARFLLFAAERWGSDSAEGVVIGTALRHHEIAAMIGAGREWVTMTLVSLRRRRMLAALGRRIVLRNADAIRALAARDELR